MNIITKQRDENLKNFNPFKIIFCKYKDKKVEEDSLILPIEQIKSKEDIVQQSETKKPNYFEQSIGRVPPRSINSYSEEFVERTFNRYHIGETLYVSSKRFTVNKIPTIDYNRTYLPFFLLVKNGFLKEN